MLHVVIDVSTIRKTPVPGPVKLDGVAKGAAVSFKRTAPNRFEADIADNTDYQLVVSAANYLDFYNAVGTVNLNFSSRQVDASGTDSITKLQMLSPGGSKVLKVEMVMQRIIDVTNEFTPNWTPDQRAWQCDSQILSSGGSGPTLVNGREVTAKPKSENLRIYRWKQGGSGPRIGVYVPEAAKSKLGSYDLFFKPYRYQGWTVEGITNKYMTWCGAYDHKCMAAATELSGSPYVTCLAFQEDGDLGPYGSTGQGVVDLIEEIDFEVRKRFNGPKRQPLCQVDRIALSCFSSGSVKVASIFKNLGPLAGKLKAYFSLDMDGHPGHAFGQIMSHWISGGGDRTVRFYQTQDLYFDVFQGRGGSTVKGPHGAFEFRSATMNPAGAPTIQFLYLPLSFWSEFDPYYSSKPWETGVHQAPPKMFLGHAHKFS
jgi:hypothetical protein